MSSAGCEPVTIQVNDTVCVSGLWHRPVAASACLTLAHGAGAGMRHAFLEAIAGELAARGIATLRYQFPYCERGQRRPDPPALCHATVRAAALQAATLAPTLPRFAGGKSFGGRMTSGAAATARLEGVRALLFLGFPLHPPGHPGDERAQHLYTLQLPMLFLQGTRDEFAALERLTPVIERLGERATLKLFQDADHSYHVPARSGRTDAQLRAELAQTMTDWIQALI